MTGVFCTEERIVFIYERRKNNVYTVQRKNR